MPTKTKMNTPQSRIEALPEDLVNPLASPLERIKGVGPKTAQALAGAGLQNVFELLLCVPKSVVEELDCPGFAFMEAGRTYVAKGRVLATKITGMGHRKRLEAVLQDDSGRLAVVFFGPAVNYAQALLKNDAELTVIGEAKSFLGRVQMVHPKLLGETKENVAASKQSRYSQIGGIQPKTFKAVVDKALGLVKKSGYGEHLPADFLRNHQLSPLADALFRIHHPPEGEAANWDERARDPHFSRLAFEELLAFYVRLYMDRRKDHGSLGRSVAKTELATLIKGVLPFSLTAAQERVVREIIDDMQENKAMARLVQGDVGSGKTAVSALSALHIVRNGGQVAVMAPTEILAEQLFSVYQSFLRPQAIKIALITASTKTKERRVICEMLKEGEIHIAIGTHALMSTDVRWKALDLVIIDEQHRFGVKQRAALLEECTIKQGYTPHLIVMSATPIPRSLALTIYGDLDLSVVDERPPGRISIATKILSGPPLASLERLASRIIETKQKAFVVFPLVEESEHLDLENATKAALLLKERFGHHACLLLHGRMSADEKQAAMQSFKEGEATFLVATTVIEVGVDVPNATCMVIVHPERFGLAQLHQLRGRVGRGTLASYCFLLTDIKNRMGTAYKRLDALCRTENGFELAQIDLEIRGPGELLGTRQAGLPNFYIFNHQDFADLVYPAKNCAKALAKSPPHHSIAHLLPAKEAHFS